MWGAVKDFLLRDSFCADLLERVKQLHLSLRNGTDGEKLEKKIKLIASQIEVLAERIGLLAKDFDPQPLLDQLRRLQQSKAELERQKQEAAHEGMNSNDEDIISFQSLAAFRKGFKELIELADSNLELMTKIIAKTVKRVAIKPDGCEIQFFIGCSPLDKKNGVSLRCLIKSKKKQ